MKVLVIGNGAREHAVAWKLAQSSKVQRVYVAPGNGGTASDPALVNVPIIDLNALADFAAQEKIVLTVVGPEAPLAAGVVDLFRSRGLRIFGPTRAAAQLESSKAFAKDFMQRHGIPTARYAVFTDAAAAHAHVTQHGAPIVIKADGLAAGKGVVVAMTADEAHAAIDFMLADDSGPSRVVIEEFMAGEEASFIVVADGKHALALATSQDHKRIGDGDTGPNTGGMGAYSPAPVVTPSVHARVMREVILPTIAGMAADGHPFSGFLYAGLMIDGDGKARVVEFNARLGDPEAQVLLMRLKSDLYELLMAATDAQGGGVRDTQLQWDRRSALGVVMASAGYPANPRLGDAITGLPAAAEDMHVFHAATTKNAAGDLVTSGGRVLTVTALGDPLRVAQQRAYAALEPIRFEGMQWRRDIGHRALKAR
jgi:phosphoribosylamine---glycine ligase